MEIHTNAMAVSKSGDLTLLELNGSEVLHSLELGRIESVVIKEVHNYIRESPHLSGDTQRRFEATGERRVVLEISLYNISGE